MCVGTQILCQLVLLAVACKGNEAWNSSHNEFTAINQQLEAVQEEHEEVECPTWFFPVTNNGSTWCECRDNFVEGGAVLRCPQRSKVSINFQDQLSSNGDLNVSILSAFCMTHDFDRRQTVIAICPYNKHLSNSSDFFVKLPSNISDLNNFMCSISGRKGELCNSCINNFGPSIFIESLKCSPVYNTTALSWFYFIAKTFITPTVFFLVVLFCKIRTTTGPLNSLIFFSQILSVIIVLLQINILPVVFDTKREKCWRSASEGARIVMEETVGTFYTFWFNQYLWSTNFAVSTKLSSMQVLSLEYVTALYPLLLILLSSTLIWMHNHGCRLLICVWKVFRWCTRHLKIRWDPISSIVHTFATFILLIYTTVLFVSFHLLTPSRIYNQSGELDYMIMSFDSSIHFFSRQHIPYVILSLSMLAVFCGLPLLILLLYPMACFQKLLNKTPVLFREIIHSFGKAYTGCYKDGPRGSRAPILCLLLLFPSHRLFCLLLLCEVLL